MSLGQRGVQTHLRGGKGFKHIFGLVRGSKISLGQ